MTGATSMGRGRNRAQIAFPEGEYVFFGGGGVGARGGGREGVGGDSMREGGGFLVVVRGPVFSAEGRPPVFLLLFLGDRQD